MIFFFNDLTIFLLCTVIGKVNEVVCYLKKNKFFSNKRKKELLLKYKSKCFLKVIH